MQVRYDEGVAIHIDHEPCAVACEGDSEASAEEHIGQPLSPAKIHIPGADAVAKAEGSASRTKFTFLLVIPTTRAHHAGRDTDGRVSASAWRTGVVEEPGMCGSSLHGNREILCLKVGAQVTASVAKLPEVVQAFKFIGAQEFDLRCQVK